jgi:hypothetical protein
MGENVMNDTRLQELYARTLSQSGRGSEACVSPEELLALIRRQGPEEHRLQLLDHVMACPACHRDFELLRALEVAGDATTAKPAPVRSIARRVTPWALAASLLLAIGAALVLRGRGLPEDTPRGGGQGLVLLTPPMEVATGQALTFSWHAAAGVQQYRLEVLDATGTQVFSQTTADTVLPWAGNSLQPGKTYQWWVRDATPGARRGSDLRSLRIRRK